jgi:two-component system nitrogen regulation sensor histidine kinase NtrY
VFNNLLKNAYQAKDESNNIEINVSLKEKASSLLVAIKDNGIGISDDQKANLFTPSFTTKSTGMGLGLSMVKNIVAGMGGDIWFQSKQNQGTTFYLSFKKEQSV